MTHYENFVMHLHLSTALKLPASFSSEQWWVEDSLFTTDSVYCQHCWMDSSWLAGDSVYCQHCVGEQGEVERGKGGKGGEE